MTISKQQIEMTAEKWSAIINNDPFYDNKFFYGVKTTRIFCKPSCKSRVPKKENVRIFPNAKVALQDGFRPCKRCKPTNERLPDREWVSLVKQYIENNFADRLTLTVLGEVSHGSPYHLQRTFTKVAGISPAQYTKQVRINRASQLLIETDQSVAKIGEQVGINNQSYFVTTFKNVTGLTPTQFRKKERSIFKKGVINND